MPFNQYKENFNNRDKLFLTLFINYNEDRQTPKSKHKYNNKEKDNLIIVETIGKYVYTVGKLNMCIGHLYFLLCCAHVQLVPTVYIYFQLQNDFIHQLPLRQ